ncbi:single-stranded-DNA-specific exonuclease RecJ [Mucispirillum schaedleri]|jgi:single-stranded-DNA-specific exonuclease|nr:single-stranded-DNA-specific exonuclease RecJ [Mucispirillum schaedleri]MCX4360611.1 single-stranded-DNA-specific exonuclease RecJ [Mucispirillum schaedleri]
MNSNFKSIKYKWIYNSVDKNLIEETAYKHNMPKPVAELMLKKGISSPDDIENFFNGSLKSLRNPFEISDMEKAAERIAKAVMNHERICIYGDYDVDGITATALLYIFLMQCGANVSYYIPNRLEEGYGLNKEAVKEIAARKTNLIITVDCGISAVQEVLEASIHGMDIIITDHHQPSKELPVAAYAIINPMREDDTYPNKTLAGVGVAFKTVMALRFVLKKYDFFKQEVPNIRNLLDIVTLGTIADVMPLVDENRIFVRHGLELMSGENVRIGIDELKKTVENLSASKKMKTSNIGFQLAPRINAMGRMASSEKSFKLLVTQNRSEAKQLALELDNENKYRQMIERDILQQTYDLIEKNQYAELQSGLVIASDNWHPGVIGIVASRVVDKYFKPTVILTEDNGVYKGSARSIPGFHLYDGLSSLSDILISFGGHKYAAGVKLEKKNLEEFRNRFNEVVKTSLKEEDFIPEIYIDAEIDSKDITNEVMQWLEKLEPYGQGNKEPVFFMKKVFKYQVETFVGKNFNHLKCVFEKNGLIFEAIGYNMKEYKSLMAENDKFDILFSLVHNTWKNTKVIQLNLKDIKKSD